MYINERVIHIAMLTLAFQGGAPEQLEDTEMFLAELQQEGFVRVATELLQDKDSMAIYTLVANEDMVRSNYFRPDYKISHHVRVSNSVQAICSDEVSIVCRARNTIFSSNERGFEPL